jgi:hypothetical protein
MRYGVMQDSSSANSGSLNFDPNDEEELLSKAGLKRAMKAYKKRLKLMRLDDESRLGGGAMTGGNRSGIMAIKPPGKYPQIVWDALVKKGRLREVGHGLYEVVEL